MQYSSMFLIPLIVFSPLSFAQNTSEGETGNVAKEYSGILIPDSAVLINTPVVTITGPKNSVRHKTTIYARVSDLPAGLPAMTHLAGQAINVRLENPEEINLPLDFTMSYDPQKVTVPNHLAVLLYSDGQWEVTTIINIDIMAHTITANSGIFSVMVPVEFTGL